MYPHPVLFVAGLPKSGTSWLENMLATYPGYNPITPLDAIKYESQHGESHSYQLNDNFFSQYKNLLLVMKMHIDGSERNCEVLNSSGIKYVILSRDLRDVAVSYAFYVSRTPWHPDFQLYQQLSFDDRLTDFAERYLDEYVQWIQLWKSNRDKDNSLIIRYEELRENTPAVFSRVADHFELNSSQAIIDDITKKHSLESLKVEKKLGYQGIGSVVRKGQVGDWKIQFSPKTKELYREHIGHFLIEEGYENDLDW
jgi:hypothetical protein